MRVLSAQNVKFTIGDCSICYGHGFRRMSQTITAPCSWCNGTGRLWGTRVDGAWIEYVHWLDKCGDVK